MKKETYEALKLVIDRLEDFYLYREIPIENDDNLKIVKDWVDEVENIDNPSKKHKSKVLKEFRKTFPIGKREYIVDEGTYNPKLILFLNSIIDNKINY